MDGTISSSRLVTTHIVDYGIMNVAKVSLDYFRLLNENVGTF